MKGQLIGMIPIFFLTILFHCVPIELEIVLHTNCKALHMTPNMANITQ